MAIIFPLFCKLELDDYWEEMPGMRSQPPSCRMSARVSPVERPGHTVHVAGNGFWPSSAASQLQAMLIKGFFSMKKDVWFLKIIFHPVFSSLRWCACVSFSLCLPFWEFTQLFESADLCFSPVLENFLPFSLRRPFLSYSLSPLLLGLQW